MTKIDLITGILGSGKTTFLRRYAEDLINSGKRTAILENDFGAVNIDMMLLQDLKGENCQLEMIAGGCDSDCHRRRFKTQLISLGMQHFDRVIIEPSGIFDMDEFFDTLHEPPLDNWFEIGSIITVIDAQTEEVLPPHMEYLFASEAACCGKLVLSKTEHSSLPPEEAAANMLRRLNDSLEKIKCDRKFTAADMLVKPIASLTGADFELLRNAGYRGSSYVKLFDTDSIRSSVHYFMHINVREEDITPMTGEILSDAACGSVFRIKGYIPAGDSWLKVNIADGKTEISRVNEGQSVLIVIGDDISREDIDRHIKKYNTDPEYVSV